MTRQGPVFIGEVAEKFMVDLWERIRAHRAVTGEPMPSPHINEVVRTIREGIR